MGILPAQQEGIFRCWYTRMPIDQSEQNVLTSQLVSVQTEVLHCRAEAEFRRNVACAARRSFLDVGTLVNQSINLTQLVMDLRQREAKC